MDKISFIKTCGAPCDLIESAIKAAKEVCPDVEIDVSGRFGDYALQFTFPENVDESVRDKAYREAFILLNDYVYAMENISLAERLVELLKLRKCKISTAESFTGGGVGKRIVEIPGASEVFFEGLNTYSNQSKCLRLGVKEQTLQKFGAVSKQTAFEMADGLLRTGTCDISVATTGIAGPKSDNTQKPVGLLYIAAGYGDLISVNEYNLKGDRREITETAINLALFLAYKTLK